MAVSADEYELPKAVADTVKELSRMVSVSESSIHSAIRRDSSGKHLDLKFIKVIIEEEE